MAGAIGGSSGDFMMHSVDTVKTRQQAAPHILKYDSMGRAYGTILREEGIIRGLYGGVLPMLLGSGISPLPRELRQSLVRCYFFPAMSIQKEFSLMPECRISWHISRRVS
jgi:hypothetical protein